jgi:hypothetical protein
VAHAGAAVLLAACARGTPAVTLTPRPAASVEQRFIGNGPAPQLVESFDGLGTGFTGPQGRAVVRNPSDNSLAVGRDHIVQTVNSRVAIFTRHGSRFDSTGRVLYGPVPTNTLFRGAGGACESRNSGDAVARYDQLAERWLIVMPVFQRSAWRADDPPAPKPGVTTLSRPLRPGQPGAAAENEIRVAISPASRAGPCAPWPGQPRN